MLLDKVQKTIDENGMLSDGDTVLCAVSGGADSVCLLHVIRSLKERYNLTVYVANVNHLIRGEESDRDSDFVKSISKAAGVECFYREYDVTNIAKERRIGEEECGRILRYEFFEELSQKLGNAKIATAHNLNDNAETVLFRLVRGSSAAGISGIKYKRGNIIRPLLDVSREEIEKYLLKRGLSWCEDSTNRLTIYNRNKLRLSVMPLLDEISQNSQARIVTAAKLISEDDAFINDIAKKKTESCFFGEYVIIESLMETPLPVRRRIAADILRVWGAKDITFDKIETFLSFVLKESGKKFDINSDAYAEISYGKVYLRKRDGKNVFSAKLWENGSCGDKSWKITARVSDTALKKGCNSIAVLDADKVSVPLVVRYKKDGDRIVPKGMSGTKKLSDIFSDEKIERQKREEIPVVECGNDIVFICGLRQSALYSPDEKTKKYLIIEYNTDEKI